MRKEGFANEGIPSDEINDPDIVEWDTAKYTDWEEKVNWKCL